LDDVIVHLSIVEIERIAQTGTPARLHSDAQGVVLPLVLGRARGFTLE
jgi:hypothetical protein